jgi:addiction module RelE/StbE family toxin
MQFVFKKTFIKQYYKLSKSDQKKVDQALLLLEKNPQDPKLKNHALIGKLEGKRAIAAGFDLRIILEVENEYLIVIVLAVSSHNQVY